MEVKTDDTKKDKPIKDIIITGEKLKDTISEDENADWLERLKQTYRLKEQQTTTPTHEPKNWYDQMVLYNGSLYININNTWKPVGTSYDVRSLNSSGSTGDQAVTGIGFTPRMVKITADYGAGSVKGYSYGVSDGASDKCMTQWFDNTGAISQNIISNYIINLINDAGSTVFLATLKSFDSDGFTINITNAVGGACDMLVECYS